MADDRDDDEAPEVVEVGEDADDADDDEAPELADSIDVEVDDAALDELR